MENKYSYNKWSMEGYGYLYRITKETETEKIFVAEFREEKDALEYIAFKNQPRIDKNLKDEIISLLDNQSNILLSIDERGDISNYTSAIEIISNLPTGEN